VAEIPNLASKDLKVSRPLPVEPTTDKVQSKGGRALCWTVVIFLVFAACFQHGIVKLRALFSTDDM